MTLSVWQNLPKRRDELLYNCSEFDRQNDEWVDFPIGMSWQIVNYPEPIESLLNNNNKREQLVLCAINATTDRRRRGGGPINRESILRNLLQSGIHNQSMDSITYLKTLSSYKFVISPEGNGIDCHRHYEALMAGCIPIIEDNEKFNLREKYGNCPILFTKDYSEITPEYLESKYEEMIHKVWDFSRLYLSYYNYLEQRQIRENGNYWGQRVAQKKWYVHSEYCVVFVCNKPYFEKFVTTCHQLVTNGKYTGPICLVIGDDLLNDTCLQHPLIRTHNIQIKHFPTDKFPNEFLYIQSKMSRESHWANKLFQYHKLNLFHSYFKKYDYILYLDCGITIYSDILPILDERRPNTILAHSDAFPTYKSKLHDQFEKNNVFYTQLDQTYNLNIDYFQTTVMLYHTNIIKNDTYHNLYKLMIEYPISITNDQGIIALYFTSVNPCFAQLRIHNDTHYFYDYISRRRENKYIMLKSLEQNLWV
jgi:hypothetical protein